ncbi:hypothetical protein CCMA1212_008422 [Trichoderma ghanense]|uniref:Uncharacterized protein n=1 Tax=Trichoderma ghanense TaxID=65468 RepID=A0ABY2GUZ1_9HYPO
MRAVVDVVQDLCMTSMDAMSWSDLDVHRGRVLGDLRDGHCFFISDTQHLIVSYQDAGTISDASLANTLLGRSHQVLGTDPLPSRTVAQDRDYRGASLQNQGQERSHIARCPGSWYHSLPISHLCRISLRAAERAAGAMRGVFLVSWRIGGEGAAVVSV